MTATDYIRSLELRPHPEGGYYRETYRCGESITQSALPARYQGARAISTSIYFLLDASTFSAFHRLTSDEQWFFHDGQPLRIHMIHDDGHYTSLLNGPDIHRGHQLHVTFPAGCWFAARVEPPGSFGLISCTVAPGFEFADFELARRDELSHRFPQHAELIRAFTRT